MAILKSVANATENVLAGIGVATAKGTAEGAIPAAKKIGREALNWTTGIAKTTADLTLRENPNRLLGYEFNAIGKTAFIGAMAIGGISSGLDNRDQMYMGVPGGLVNSTPSMNMATMAQDYGAGGDLVFALNRNRRG